MKCQLVMTVVCAALMGGTLAQPTSRPMRDTTLDTYSVPFTEPPVPNVVASHHNAKNQDPRLAAHKPAPTESTDLTTPTLSVNEKPDAKAIGLAATVGAGTAILGLYAKHYGQKLLDKHFNKNGGSKGNDGSMAGLLGVAV